MTDNNKLSPVGSKPDGLTRKQTVSLPGLHARLYKATSTVPVASTMANRLALMLDVSGSMRGDKISKLRDAVQGFITQCNMNDTAIAIESFGKEASTHVCHLTTQQPLLLTSVWSLEAAGGTPMHLSMNYVLSDCPVTRGVIVSDGCPDRQDECLEIAHRYVEAEIPVDCVHIGDSANGEAHLSEIARITGGKFIKFTDIASFSKSFKYLTPRYYAMLIGGGITAAELGAKELK